MNNLPPIYFRPFECYLIVYGISDTLFHCYGPFLFYFTSMVVLGCGHESYLDEMDLH